MAAMPKYNLNDFFKLSLKTLVNRTGHYFQDAAIEEIKESLKDIYGLFLSDIEKEFERYNLVGSYFFDIYPKLFDLVKHFQLSKTEDMGKHFGLSKEQLMFLTGMDLQELNNIISKYIFYSLHNDRIEKPIYNLKMETILQKIQLFKSSINEWGLTCGKGNNYLSRSLNNISQSCFSKNFSDTAQVLYDLKSDNVKNLSYFKIEDILELAQSSYPDKKLLSASNLAHKSIERFQEIFSTAERPYILVADESGLSLNAINENTVGYTINKFFNISWNLYAKLYGLSALTSIVMNRFLLSELPHSFLTTDQIRILPLRVIFRLPDDVAQSFVDQEYKNSVQQISRLSIQKLERIFEFSDENLKSRNLLYLSNVLFTINPIKFFDYFNVTKEKEDFYKTATLYDYSLLLAIDFSNIQYFSISQLIEQTQNDALYAEVMLTSPNQLILTRTLDVDRYYTLSICQIARFHSAVNSYQDMYDYLQKWTKSNDASRILLEKSLNDLSQVILQKTENIAKMRIVDIVNAVLGCKWFMLSYEVSDFSKLFKEPSRTHAFFISNTFISNARLKSVKHN